MVDFDNHDLVGQLFVTHTINIKVSWKGGDQKQNECESDIEYRTVHVWKPGLWSKWSTVFLKQA